MPMYDFVCNACGARFEAIVRLGALAPCQQCQSSQVERLPSAFAIGGLRPKSEAPAPAGATQAGSGQLSTGKSQVHWGYGDEKNYFGDDDY